MRPRELHSYYYRDRWSERDLCNDFPGDEILIDGLHAMQRHLWNNGVQLTIPVVRVMNTAHFIAAYMFATTCSGEQLEYDALADMSLGRDRQMFRVALIVLAAMLARTEGYRARQCRNLILDNRDPDFDEGVTLYDRFLQSAEKRFAEEDFLIDTHEQIQRLTAQNEQLIAENTELKIKYHVMEEKYQQVNIGTQNNNCTQIENQYNITYVVPAQEDTGWSKAKPNTDSGHQQNANSYTPPIPREGDYNGVRLYIEERKKYDEQFKDYCTHHNRKELCMRLTKEFGWFVDDKSLGRNIQRNI